MSKALDGIRERPAPAGVEWPTILVALVIHAAWIVVTLAHDAIPLPVLIALGGWMTAWHGSLQHEVIHGHPTPWTRLNHALAAAPLSLWLPFHAYHRSHLAHHATDGLTDPDLDPESRYTRRQPTGFNKLRDISNRVQARLIGRLTIGPALDIVAFLAVQLRAVVRNEPHARRTWAWHGLALLPLLAWLHWVCHLPLTTYIACFVYPGAALSMLRSFAEHRADPDSLRRVAVVENAPLLGLLFLHNNLHAAHHRWPSAPWFSLPRLHAEHRERLLSANGRLVYDGYADVVRRYLFRAHDLIDYEAAVTRAGANPT